MFWRVREDPFDDVGQETRQVTHDENADDDDSDSSQADVSVYDKISYMYTQNAEMGNP